MPHLCHYFVEDTESGKETTQFQHCTIGNDKEGKVGQGLGSSQLDLVPTKSVSLLPLDSCMEFQGESPQMAYI